MKTPKIYIANGKLAHEVLQYRCPRTRQLRSLRIGAGRQAEISGNYNVDEIHQIVTQLLQYHDEVKSVGELRSMTNPRGLLFCVDNPIPADTIQEGIEKNKEIAQDIASSEAENAGLAAFAAARSVVGDVKETTLEVVQQDEHGVPARGRAVDFEFNVSKATGARSEGKRRRA